MSATVKSLQKDFFGTANRLSKAQLEDLITYLNEQYYNKGISLISDDDYDRVRSILETRFGKSKLLDAVGSSVIKQKAKLPFFLGSMDKIKPDKNNLEAWLLRYTGDVCISEKLDGISALVVKKDGKTSLYTRGDGTIGQDISHMLPFIKVGDFEGKESYAVRGELITTKANYAKVSEGKRGARQMVSGLANQKTIGAETRALMELVDFVAYEVIVPEGLKPSQQFTLLDSKSTFKVPDWQLAKEISIGSLSEVLTAQKGSSPYEIDGIIVAHNAVHSRGTSKNPEHAFAFKMAFADQEATTEVLRVIWEASKDGYLKPTVAFEPVNIGGVIIQYATGFNAAFIESNKIGPKAYINIIRSGDVIPYIKEVRAPAPKGADMPTEAWHWNDTHVDAILDNVGDSAEVQKQILLHFAKTLDIAFCGAGNIAKLYEIGVKTPEDLLRLRASDLEGKGFAKTSSEKLVAAIGEARALATPAQWAVGSGIFGRGVGIKRMELALKVVPADFSAPPDLVKKIAEQGGWSRESSEAFVARLPKFQKFMKGLGFKAKTPPKTVPRSSKMSGQLVLFTGFHPKDLEAAVIAEGGEIADTLVKKVSLVVVKDATVDNAKTQKARASGIPVKTAAELTAILEGSTTT